MPLKPEEFTQSIQSVLSNLSDQAAASTALASLGEEFTALYTSNETAATEKAALMDANEKLRAANLDLFTRLGTQKQSAGATAGAISEEQKPEIKKYEDLFNEKGELK